MKVKMLIGMASEDNVRNPGDIVDVKKEIAEAWQEAEIAEIIESKAIKGGSKKGDK